MTIRIDRIDRGIRLAQLALMLARGSEITSEVIREIYKVTRSISRRDLKLLEAAFPELLDIRKVKYGQKVLKMRRENDAHAMEQAPVAGAGESGVS